MLTISTGEVRVWLLLLSSEFHLDGISSLSEEMDGGDLVWSAPPDCLSNNEGPPHLPLQPQGFPDLEGELTIVSSEVNKKLDQVVEYNPYIPMDMFKGMCAVVDKQHSGTPCRGPTNIAHLTQEEYREPELARGRLAPALLPSTHDAPYSSEQSDAPANCATPAALHMLTAPVI